MLSTNLDRAGRPFVSSFEAKSYPFCEQPLTRKNCVFFLVLFIAGIVCLTRFCDLSANPSRPFADGTQWHPEKSKCHSSLPTFLDALNEPRGQGPGKILRDCF